MRTQICALALLMVVALGATALPAMADTQGSSIGSFDLGNSVPLDLTAVALYDSDESTVTTQMAPQTEYAVKISVTNGNTLNDIDTIVVVVKEAAHSGDDSATHQATYQWSSTGGWSMIGPGGTWSIDVADCDVPTLTGTSGDWCLHFTPGKVAIESVSNWMINATVTDKGSLSDNAPELTGLGMLWYGEISVVDESFGFGSISLGDTDKPITGDDTDVDVKAIANGAYQLETKSGDWTKGADTAILDWDGTLDPGHFALENDGDGDDITSNYVQDSYTTVTDFVSKTAPTAEGGDDEAIFVWVSVASSGFVLGIYSGTYNVQIGTA